MNTQIGAANLRLPRDMLLHDLEDNILKAYLIYMVNVSRMFGANQSQADNDYTKVLKFEMQLANVSRSHHCDF